MKKRLLWLLIIPVLLLGIVLFISQQNRQETVLLGTYPNEHGVTEIYSYKGVDATKLPTSYIPANLRVYENESELANGASLVVLGSVETTLDQDKTWLGIDPLDKHILSFYTISSFRVDEVIYGDCDDKYINIIQGIAILKNEQGEFIKAAIEGCEELKKDDMYILYLTKPGDVFLDTLGENTYGTLSLYHGIINLSEPAPKSRLSDTHYDTRMSSIRQGVLERFSSELKAEGVFIAE